MTDPAPGPPTDPAPAPATAPEPARDEPWQRLHPRMLLVHPIRELARFFPVLVGLFVAGTASGGIAGWQAAGVLIPVGLGLLRYLTTTFRIGNGRVELRRGLLNRHTLSTPLDRVRTVDLTASPIQRILGLTTVRVGTGTASTSDDERLDLDGLPADRARELRSALLQVTPAYADVETTDEQVVVRFAAGWLRFAPLTSSGLALSAAILGLGSQVLDRAGLWEDVDVEGLVNGAAGLSAWVLVPLLVAGALVAISLLSIAGYVVTNWRFTLTRAVGSWHVRKGLLTTRETSLDEERVRGVSLGEPLGLRVAGGGRLSAVVTGLDRRQAGSSVLVPPAPATEVRRVAAEVLGTPEPLTVTLTDHGPAARTRRYTRAVVPTTLVAGVPLLLVVLGDAPARLLVPAGALVVAAVALAADRARALGHALVGQWFVARSGSLTRRRVVLASDAIIGWNFSSTFFQRRAGLTTLVATTAGGRQSVTALDVPEGNAVAVAVASVPRLVEQFLDGAHLGAE